ncbi:MAG: hypothetical protein ACJAXA_000548 [Candidatus Aldehydirespiratoraceae bacterium]|jgi:hypothetical protein
MELAVDHRTPSLSTPLSRRDPAKSEALRHVLAALGERVKPVALARDRTMPVAAPFDRLLPEDGLVRGHVMSCQGAAATSMAFGLVRDALVAGAWMAVVDVATFGTDAAAEFGIPLERVVRIETGVDSSAATDLEWIDVMGAAVDGFDLVVTRVPAGLTGDHRPAAVRKFIARLQQKGAVVVVLGASGALAADIELTTAHTVWSGLGDGSGHLRQRVIDIEASGRRLPGARTCSIQLVGQNTGSESCVEFDLAPTPASSGRDPQAELLAEMASSVTVTDLNDDRRLVG